MKPEYKELIKAEFVACTTNTLSRLEHRSHTSEANTNPFQEHLLPQDAIFWARFERSYSTSFGQKLVEKISKYVALAYGAEASETQKSVHFSLSKTERNNISSHLEKLRNKSPSRGPNWKRDLHDVTEANPKRDVPIHVNFDLWFRKAGVDNYVSIKTVKPNIDQTEKAKSDLLRTKLGLPNSNVYYGLYYNPYGTKSSDYNHRPPFTIFDMINDECVLIGERYWDTIGAPGAFEKILDIAKSASKESLEKIEAYGKKLEL